jgi:hypothetical protein
MARREEGQLRHLPEVQREGTQVTRQQRLALQRLAAGESLWRDQVRGVTPGNRWIVYRWNEVDRAVTLEFVQRLVEAGWADYDDEDGNEVVKITESGRQTVSQK